MILMDNKLDRIVVTESQLNQILGYKPMSAYENTMNLFATRLIMNKGILLIEELTQLNHQHKNYSYAYYFSVDEQSKVISHEVYGRYKGTDNIYPLIKFDTAPNGKYKLIHFETHWTIDPTKAASMYMSCFFRLMEYIANGERERINVTRTKVKTKPGKLGKIKYRKVITLTPKIYIYDNKGSVEKREINRLMESWGVRGHWREYKSGKRIWVKPYEKGIGEKDSKEYRLP